MTWRGSSTPQDRFFACLPYLLPLIEGLVFGTFLVQQFPVLGIIFLPLLPLIQLYGSIPFAGLVVFFALFLLVVRNEGISHFIRFNTMQAILFDIILILCLYIAQWILRPVFAGGFVTQTLFSVVFLGNLAAIGYSIFQTVLGRYAEIPPISDAVHMQVR
ncbi:hypothetical protein BST81_03140 [Leptolyngbya sp. 'hensonii']|uniref:Tic20 family protein n=1 Tax=Leptolyngbya sp. 'hensonii' TaxID=1922337 RepID=UPI00094F4A83|nr:Tic20 family protein [Leptolyngbya sp. 'hensonii']OLP19901.1 hypothetical protein BST81_03140 [Leptolyngbya sp. 'hensonii']